MLGRYTTSPYTLRGILTILLNIAFVDKLSVFEDMVGVTDEVLGIETFGDRFGVQNFVDFFVFEQEALEIGSLRPGFLGEALDHLVGVLARIFFPAAL